MTIVYAPASDGAGGYNFWVFRTCVRGYVRTNVRPSVRMCVRTYVRDPVRLRLRHLYQVEPELLRVHIIQTILHVWFIFGLMIDIGQKFYSAIPRPMPMTLRSRSWT